MPATGQLTVTLAPETLGLSAPSCSVSELSIQDHDPSACFTRAGAVYVSVVMWPSGKARHLLISVVRPGASTGLFRFRASAAAARGPASGSLGRGDIAVVCSDGGVPGDGSVRAAEAGPATVVADAGTPLIATIVIVRRSVTPIFRYRFREEESRFRKGPMRLGGSCHSVEMWMPWTAQGNRKR